MSVIVVFDSECVKYVPHHQSMVCCLFISAEYSSQSWTIVVKVLSMTADKEQSSSFGIRHMTNKETCLKTVIKLFLWKYSGDIRSAKESDLEMLVT